jgi:uncharacterized protein (TIGR02757 family)
VHYIKLKRAEEIELLLANLKEFLDNEVEKRDIEEELTPDKPDPLIVVQRHQDEMVALISALFAYGKASLILKFLESLDFSILKKSEDEIREALKDSYYRFQSSEDVVAIFTALSRISKSGQTLEEIFVQGYKKESNVLDGIAQLIEAIREVYPYSSRGYSFLLGKAPNSQKPSGQSPYKRWNLFLRWLVRSDNLDIGLWKSVDKRDLLIPLDTHTFNISQELGLLSRKSYDLKAVVELTDKLREFDQNDPVKYDFAIYRVGQEKILSKLN